MPSYTVLYNPLAGNGSGYKMAKSLKKKLKGDRLRYQDVTRILDYDDFLKSIPADEKLIVCGGDGTLNRFINFTDGVNLPNEIFYCPGGSGNDFMNDVGGPGEQGPLDITRFVEKLPLASVKGKNYYFQNGIGMGIDGYCCEVGERTRGTSKKPINYTKIALEGFLFKFEPRNAVVTIDGKTTGYRNVWMAATMVGRYLGGGMMLTPDQDRLNPDHTVSVMILHKVGRLAVLPLLTKVFKGEHVKYTQYVEIITGHEIKIQYDRPAPIQIDGEVIPAATEYTVVYR